MRYQALAEGQPSVGVELWSLNVKAFCNANCDNLAFWTGTDHQEAAIVGAPSTVDTPLAFDFIVAGFDCALIMYFVSEAGRAVIGLNEVHRAPRMVTG